MGYHKYQEFFHLSSVSLNFARLPKVYLFFHLNAKDIQKREILVFKRAGRNPFIIYFNIWEVGRSPGFRQLSSGSGSVSN